MREASNDDNPIAGPEKLLMQITLPVRTLDEANLLAQAIVNTIP